jgi:methionyl aminopeptidase
LNYGGSFPGTLCINLNEVIVHGFPSSYQLRDGDILGVDCGVKLNGFHSDSAFTYAVGEVSGQIQNLLGTTKDALFAGIDQMRTGKRLGDVSFAIQEVAKKGGVSIVRELTGHGIGRNLHEDPNVPNYGNRGRGPKLQNGMVLAIEPMFNLGRREVIQLRDGWTIRTKDKMPSAHFEHTVAIWDGEPEIITSWKYIEEALKKKYAKAS